MYDAPPVLTGAAAVAAADRVLHRALAKAPAERYPTAEAFAADLRSALAHGRQRPGRGRAADPPARRPAVSIAQAGCGHRLPRPESRRCPGQLARRPRVAGGALDAEVRPLRPAAARSRSLAADLAVDVVLSGHPAAGQGAHPGQRGTRRRAGRRRLVVARHRRVARRGARAARRAGAARARGAAAEPARSTDARGPAPHNEKAFELYLRGMQLRAEAGAWRQAHAFFVQSLECDHDFAAAWAERGRLERILGKFEDPSQLAAGRGLPAAAPCRSIPTAAPRSTTSPSSRSISAGSATRWPGCSIARWKRRAEPHVFAALVHACRYGGLLDASVAAHRAAVRLDPTVADQRAAHLLSPGRLRRGRSTRCTAAAIRSRRGCSARWAAATRPSPRLAREETRYRRDPAAAGVLPAVRAGLAGRRRRGQEAMRPFDDRPHSDGEMLFYVAEIHALVGDDRARLGDAGAGRGRRASSASPAFERDVYLAPLRTREPGHRSWPASPRRSRRRARVFDQHRGRALLGL